MAEQQAIAFAWNDAQKGRQLDVLIDSKIPGESPPGLMEGQSAWIGRTYADAPDVDSVVYVTGTGLHPGMMVSCEIVASREYDLIAVACGDPH